MKRKAILAAIIVLAILAVIGSVFTGQPEMFFKGWRALPPKGNFAVVSRDKNLTVVYGKTIKGDVLVVNADARISGDVTGSLIVRNGNLILLSGGKIQGDAVVVGGQLHVADNATVSGKKIMVNASIFGPPEHKFGPPEPGFDPPEHGFGPPGHEFGPPPGRMFILKKPGFGLFGPGLEYHAYGFGHGRDLEPRFLIGLGIRLFFMLLTLGIFTGASIFFAKARPETLKRAGDVVIDRTLASVLIGSIVLAILFLAINAIRIFVGFPVVALLGLAIGILALILAIIPAHLIGIAVGRSLSEKYTFVKQTAIGALVVGLSIFMPFFGSFILIACSALGIGSLILLVWKPKQTGTVGNAGESPSM